MKLKKRFSIFALILCLILALQGCTASKSGGIFGSAGSADSSVSSASVAPSASTSSKVTPAASKAAAGDTQLIDADTYSVEIPSTWTKTKYSGVDLFIPQDADMTKGASNINIVTSALSGTVPTLKDYNASFPAEFEKQMASAFPNAKNFQYSSTKAGGMDVFIASCDSTDTMKQTQYYPINSKYVVVLTVTDIGDGDKTGLQDIAKHMLDTLTLK
jgi:hypothetical protein